MMSFFTFHKMAMSSRLWRVFSDSGFLLILVSICQHATSVKSVYVSELCKFDNFCQPIGTNWWKYHSEHCLSCSSGKRYHCARDYDQPEVFKEGCAVEQFCPEGEEPKLSFLRDKKEITEPDVFCDDCYDKNRYNSRKNTSSAEFSECPHEKKNICTDEEHKKLCKPDDATDERYCRCDARKGYSPVNDFTHAVCSYENYDCKDYFKCDEGTQLLLNYTCGDNCPVGFDRISENDDNCFQIIKTETTENPVLSPSTTKNNFPSSSYIVPKTTVQTQSDCLEACDVYEVCEKGKCVCPNSCANLVKPVCGYHELSGKYQTFSSNCELRKTYCREKEFQYYSIVECKKESPEAWVYRLIIGILCALVVFLIIICFIIYKSRLGKKKRDRFCPSPGNRDIIVEIPSPITEVDGNNQTGKFATTADETLQMINGTTTKQNGEKQDNSNIKGPSTAPLSSHEDVSMLKLSTFARKVSSPKIVVHKTKNIYVGPVIKSKDGETMISIGNGSYDKNSMVKIIYNKDDEKEEGDTIPLLEDGEFSSDNNPSSVPVGHCRVLPKEAAKVFCEKPDETDLADNEVTQDANNDRKAHVDTVNEPEINAHGLHKKVETDVGDGNHVSQRLRKQNNPHGAKLGSFYRSRKDSMSCDSLFLEPEITAIHVLCENRDQRKELIKRVMDRSSGYLLDNMDPTPVIDKFTAKEILTNVSRRNISDLQIQTREIIKRIRETGMQNYQRFKNCLWETKQISCLDEVQDIEKKVLQEIQTASHHDTHSSSDREKSLSAESNIDKTQANDEYEVSKQLSDDNHLVFEQNYEDIPCSDTDIKTSGEDEDKRRYEGQKNIEKDPSSWQPLEELEQV